MKLTELLSRVIPSLGDKKLFSIITPCYNAEKYLPTLFANLEQYSLPEQQWEVIFIDDGSNDNTVALLQEFCQNKANCKLFTNQHNGVSVARNLGIEQAKGEWILFLDCDDWYSADFLTHLAQAIQDYPNHRVFMGEIVMFQEADQSPHPDPVLSQPVNVLQKDEHDRWIFNILDNNDLHRTAARLAFKRDLINKYKLRFNPIIEYGEDLLFHWQYIIAIKEEQKQNPDLILEGIFLPQCSYFYFHAIKQSSRATDRRSKNQTKIMTNAAHGFRAIAHDYHAIADFAKHLGSFSYFALLEDKAYKSIPETLEFTKELQYWLEIIKQNDITKSFINSLIWNRNLAGNFQHLLWLVSGLENTININSSVNFLKEVDRTSVSTEVKHDFVTLTPPNYDWTTDGFVSPEQRYTKAETVYWRGKLHYCIFSNQSWVMEYLFPRFADIAEVVPYKVLACQIGWLVYLPIEKVNFFRKRKLIRFLCQEIKQNFSEFARVLPLEFKCNKEVYQLPEHPATAKELLKSTLGAEFLAIDKLKSVLALITKGKLVTDKLVKQKLTNYQPLAPAKLNKKPGLFYRLFKSKLYTPARKAYLCDLSYFVSDKLLAQVSHSKLPLGEYYLVKETKLSLYAKLRLLDYPNLKLLFTETSDYQEFTADLLELLANSEPNSPVSLAVQQLLARCFVRDQK